MKARTKTLTVPHSELFQRQLFISSVLNLLAGFFYFDPSFPFSRLLPLLGFVSAGLYFAYFLLYRRFEKYHFHMAALVSVTSYFFLGVVAHISGGVTSPFIFLYFCILSSEEVFGLSFFRLPALSIASYLAVVLGEYFGLLAPANDAARGIYASPVTTGVIVLATVGFMVLVNKISSLMILSLRKKVEAESAEKQTLLRKLGELEAHSQLGIVAHRIVHDLRGPISSISGYIQIELLKPKTAEEQAALSDLHSAVIGMSDSLANITSFGKASALKPEKVDLAEFMRALIAILSYSPQAHGVKFVKLYPESLALSVQASRSDLQQAYFNIIKNAVEAVKDNAGLRIVEIGIRAEVRDAVVVVSDNGPGMSPEVLKDLFRRSVTTKKEGTGVGLVITRELLLRNAVDLQFRNLEGGGLSVITRFQAA